MGVSDSRRAHDKSDPRLQPKQTPSVCLGGSAHAGAMCGTGRHSETLHMSIETLLIVVIVVLLIGGGGLYGRGRWY